MGTVPASSDDVHYRLYLNDAGEAVVVCVQWFDYFDYDESRFLSADRWDNEAEPQAIVDLVNAGLVSGPLVYVIVLTDHQREDLVRAHEDLTQRHDEFLRNLGVDGG